MGSSSKRKKEKQKDFQVSMIHIAELISHLENNHTDCDPAETQAEGRQDQG